MMPIGPAAEQELLPRWHRRHFSRIGLGLSAQMITMIAFQIAVAWLLTLLYGLDVVSGLGEAGELLFILAENILPSVLSALVFYCIVRRVPARAPEERKPLGPAAFLRAYLVSGMALYLFSYFTSLLTGLIGALRGVPVTDPTESIFEMPLPAVILITCVVAPIVEETVFRRLLLPRLRPYGDRFAVFASALCFALMHGNLSQFFYAFALGVILGQVFLNTGCVWQTMVLHGLINAIGGVLPYLTETYMGEVGYVVYLGVVLGFIVLGAVCLLYALCRKRETPPEPGAYALRAGEEWRLFFLNFGMLLFFALFGLMTVLFLIL